MFQVGQPKPPGSGRKKGSGRSKSASDIRAALALRAPEIAQELIRLALSAKREETRVAAAREVFDRVLGKSTQHVEGQMLLGISNELAQLLDRHDGNSRSIPIIEAEPVVENEKISYGQEHSRAQPNNGDLLNNGDGTIEPVGEIVEREPQASLVAPPAK